MATPRTPRKSAVKAKPDETLQPEDQVDVLASVTAASDAAPDTVDPDQDGTKPVEETPTSTKSATGVASDFKDDAVVAPDAPAKTDDTNASIEDAVVLEEPAPEAPPTRETPKPREDVAPPPPAAPTVVKNSPGFVPMVLGGVVAAGLGFAFAHYVMPGLSPLQTQLAQQAADIKALRAELQAMPKADSNTALLAEISTVRETAASALQAAEDAKTAAANITIPEPGVANDVAPEIAALAGRLAAVENRPAASNPSVDPAVIAQLTTEIDTLRSGLAAQKASAEALVAEAETIRADAAAKAQTVLLQAALTKVEAAIQNGSPFVEPLALLANADVAIPETLSSTAETGVPTMAALATAFDDPARAALEAGLRGDMGSTWTDRVGSFLRTQTGARSLTPQDGADPDAVLSRAGAAVTAGDLQTAMTEIATLPEAAQAALSAWVVQAKLHLDAKTATAALATALSER